MKSVNKPQKNKAIAGTGKPEKVLEAPWVSILNRANLNAAIMGNKKLIHAKP
jgi:hypothetical protein